jgi:Cu/Ag efflux protein CusF
VVLTHEAFPDGFMEGMTMPFETADPRLVNGFKAGDKVKFTLSNKGGDWKIVAMEAVK